MEGADHPIFERFWRSWENESMVYALWDTRTTNLVAAYDNERDALELVQSGIERNGPEDTETLVLEVEDERGELVFTTQGQALADLARTRILPTTVAGQRTGRLRTLMGKQYKVWPS